MPSVEVEGYGEVARVCAAVVRIACKRGRVTGFVDDPPIGARTPVATMDGVLSPRAMDPARAGVLVSIGVSATCSAPSSTPEMVTTDFLEEEGTNAEAESKETGHICPFFGVKGGLCWRSMDIEDIKAWREAF